MPCSSTDESGWFLPCSDDESREPKDSKVAWKPPAAEVVQLYETLENGVFELEWHCIGRRPPPIANDEFDQESEEAHESKPEEKSDFDFMDDASEPILRKSSRGGPKGSAKKKTTSFSGILSNMRRHRQQEQLEREQTALDTNKKM